MIMRSTMKEMDSIRAVQIVSLFNLTFSTQNAFYL